jgi:hypothetical protein
MTTLDFGTGHWATGQKWEDLIATLAKHIVDNVASLDAESRSLASNLEYQAFNAKEILKALIKCSSTMEQFVKDMRDLIVTRYTRGTSFTFNSKNVINKSKDKTVAKRISDLMGTYSVKKSATGHEANVATLSRICQVLPYLAIHVACQISEYTKPIIPTRPLATKSIANAIIDVVPQFIFLTTSQLTTKTDAEAALYCIHLSYQVLVSEKIMPKTQKDSLGIKTRADMVKHCMTYMNIALDSSNMTSADKTTGRGKINGEWGAKEAKMSKSACDMVCEVVTYCFKGHDITDVASEVKLLRVACECVNSHATIALASADLKNKVDN